MCLISTLTYSQQRVQGSVKDIYSEKGLEGVTVVLLTRDGDFSSIWADTDEFGNFTMLDVPFGRQSFAFQYLGYKTKIANEIIISAGKIPVIDVLLEENLSYLDEVIVTTNDSIRKSEALSKMAVNSIQIVDVETIERFSGGLRDVARLARNYAGVLNTDDSRNDILVRGNSPTGVLWRLEGVPIPNPNHFAASGTTGGPVSALNINLLKSSQFLRGAFPAEFGNVTSGVFDVNFRDGNLSKTELTAQIHARSGVELLLEGPLQKNNSSSYLFSYRHSIASLGASSTGTSAIPLYRDFSFSLNLGKILGGQVRLFGIGGKSEIEFVGSKLNSSDLYGNQNEDLSSFSEIAVVGMSHKSYVSENAFLKTNLSFNASQHRVLLVNYNTIEGIRTKYNGVDLKDRNRSYQLSTKLINKVSSKLSYNAGILFSYFNSLSKILTRDDLATEQVTSIDNDGLAEYTIAANYDNPYQQYQYYLQGKYRFSEQWNVSVGVHSQYFSLNQAQTFEPRLGLSWMPNNQHNLGLSYGKQTQTQQLPILFHNYLNKETNEYSTTNLDLGNTKSYHYIFSYSWNFSPKWALSTELYFQQLRDVPIDSYQSTFSVLNEGANFRFLRKSNLVNQGRGTNYGLELTLEKNFNKNYYILLNGSLFDSKYTPSDGIERNTAFNNKYVFNALTGKEFSISVKNGGLFTVFINTKVTGAGGGYYTPIDLKATIENNGVEVYNEEKVYAEQYPDYFRWDLKIGLRNQSKRRFSQEWSIDVLNVTDNKNLFLNRFNKSTNQIDQVNQLGRFVDILYKIQF
ncbi:MAG: TonB-dependent receptor [Bacteroidota bacterium]|nr:TonB-dependent receptor [Bacteroidota bacterium]